MVTILKIQLLFAYLKVLELLRKLRPKRNSPERSAQVIKLEHIIVLRTKQDTILFRAPWSVSVEDLFIDIERYEHITKQEVIDVGCEFDAHEVTRELVRKLKAKLL